MKTIKFSELKRLSFCNSKDLPKKIIVDGIVREWMGIGWLDTEKPPTADEKRTYPVVVEG